MDLHDTRQISVVHCRVKHRIKISHSCQRAMFYIRFGAFLTDTKSLLLIKENIAAVVPILV